MNSKKSVGKRVMFGILLIGIIIISISFVSASWRDWFNFGNNNAGEGELANVKNAQAYANVTAAANAPFVVFVSQPFYSSGGIVGGSPSLIVYPNPTIITFSFIALENSSAGACGYTSLPGANPGDPVTASVQGNINAPSSEVSRSFANCVLISDSVQATCPNTGALTRAKNYTCNVTVQYYDRGTKSSSAFYWNISVNILQSNINLWSLYNSTQQFQFNPYYNLNLSSTQLNWSKNPLVIGTGNIVSDYNITFINLGNIQLDNADGNIQINATMLNRTAAAAYGDFISSTNFTAGDSAINPCVQTGYRDEQYENVSVVVGKFISGSPGSDSKNVTFCAKNVPSYLNTGAYTSRRSWVIQTT